MNITPLWKERGVGGKSIQFSGKYLDFRLRLGKGRQAQELQKREERKGGGGGGEVPARMKKGV